MSHTVLLYERMARLGEYLSLGERREEGCGWQEAGVY